MTPEACSQCEEHIVVAHGVGAAARELDVHLRHGPEELRGLVDEVRAEIVEDAAALAGRRLGLPGCGGLGLPPLEPRLEAAHLAERSRVDELAQGEEVAVPPPVLEHRDATAESLGLGDERATLVGSHRERLVHDHVESSLERGVGEGGVRAAGRADDDEVERAGASAHTSSGVATTRASGYRAAAAARRDGSPVTIDVEREVGIGVRGTARGRRAPRCRSR